MVKIGPSVLSADFRVMGAEIERMAAAGADYLHYDVMDGNYVPNISFGSAILSWAAKGPLPIDVHLMVMHPETHVAEFAGAGAKIISIHPEAGGHTHRTLGLIREAGCLAGVALNPATPPDCLEYLMNVMDLVLIMAVNPGFGGQKLLPECLEKVRVVRGMLDRAGSKAMLQVDGGMNEHTARLAMEKGADYIVTGSAIFAAPDAKAFIDRVRADWTELHV